MITRRGAIVVLDDPAEVTQAAADRFVDLASMGLDSSGVFRVALAGGESYRPVYRLLASAEYRLAVDWSRIDFFWGDERVVPPDHPDNNFRMAKEALLDHVPCSLDRVHRIPTENADLSSVALAYEQEIRNCFSVGAGETPMFDLILLGIGLDGHTASLFPRSPALYETDRLALPVLKDDSGGWRITLTPPVLNAAIERIFVATGSQKAAIVAEVLFGPEDPSRLPAQLVRPGRSMPVWLLDDESARDLEVRGK